MQDRFKFRVWKKHQKKMVEGATYLNPLLLDEDIAPDEAKNYVVMQCTGLKDKNGKLIFEGDIVKDKFGSFYKVEYENVITGFYPFNNYDISINGYFDENIEVIGNTYENPDLLDDN